MRKFEYVPRNEWKPARKEVVEIIRSVQQILRNEFTFRFGFIGSSHRGMITREVNGNQGYDFDADLRVNDDEEVFSAEELKHMFMTALDSISWRYGFSCSKDSTSVITIKKIDSFNSRIIYSCDFAIVNNYKDKNCNPHQQFVYYNKTRDEYYWKERSREYCHIKEKEIKIKEAGMWNEVREVYLDKKCRFSYQKKSRALYAETINEVFARMS